jgi:hypothetical protein
MTDRGLFEPDALLGDQLAAARRRRATLSCERRLMLAVLQNALDYYQKYIFAEDRAGRELFEEAAEWIECTDGNAFFSFVNISETLDIDPAYFRRGVAAWRERMMEAHSRAAAMSEGAPSEEPVQAAG